MQKVDGTPVWISLTVNPVHDDQGNVVESRPMVVDVTERKKAEEEIRKFKTISDRAGYGLVIANLEGNLIYVNESFAEMHGFTADELSRKSLSIFHTEEQMKKVNRLKDQLKQKGIYVGEEVWHKRRDGSTFPTLMNGTLIMNEKGIPLFMAATAIEITERKKAEEELIRLSTAVKMSSDSIVISDLEGQIVYVNDATLKMYETANRQDLIGKKGL